MRPFDRRPHARGGMLLSLLFAVLAAPLAPQLATPSHAAVSSVRAVATVGFTVADLDRSIAFFRDVLAFTAVS